MRALSFITFAIAMSLASACGPDTKSDSSRACTPGMSQACAGPGACTGFQVCKTDGSGFDACDCSGGTGGGTGVDGGGDSAMDFCPKGLPGPELVEVPALDGSRYCVDATEVTISQFEQFMGSNPQKLAEPLLCSGHTPQFDAGCMNAVSNVGPSQPMSCANWCSAYAYCAWAGKRLCGRVGGGAVEPADLTNAATGQWFNACSAGGKQNYAYGDAGASTCDSLAAVGTRPECQGGFPGLFDMSGNVREWIDGCFTLDQGGYCPKTTGSRCDSIKQGDTFFSFAGIRCCYDGT